MKQQITFFDGAFGTYYFEKTRDYKPCELANIHSADIVTDIHKQYIAAGAQAIKTNTYSVNSVVFGEESQRKAIIKNAMINAKMPHWTLMWRFSATSAISIATNLKQHMNICTSPMTL